MVAHLRSSETTYCNIGYAVQLVQLYVHIYKILPHMVYFHIEQATLTSVLPEGIATRKYLPISNLVGYVMCR